MSIQDLTAERKAIIETELRSLMDQFWIAASETDFERIYAMVDDRHHMSAIDSGVFYPTPEASKVRFQSGIGRQDYTIDEMRIAVLAENIAAVIAHGEIAFFPNNGDKQLTKFAMSLIWIKIEDQWKLAHMHQSFPLPASE
jgi:hypothetical protein